MRTWWWNVAWIGAVLVAAGRLFERTVDEEACWDTSYLTVYDENGLGSGWRSFSWLGEFEFDHQIQGTNVIRANIRPWGALSLRAKADAPVLAGGGSLVVRAKGSGTVEVVFEATEAPEPFFSTPVLLEMSDAWKDHAVPVPSITPEEDPDMGGWKVLNFHALSTPVNLYIEAAVMTEIEWEDGCLDTVSLTALMQEGKPWASTDNVFRGSSSLRVPLQEDAPFRRFTP